MPCDQCNMICNLNILEDVCLSKASADRKRVDSERAGAIIRPKSLYKGHSGKLCSLSDIYLPQYLNSLYNCAER